MPLSSYITCCTLGKIWGGASIDLGEHDSSHNKKDNLKGESADLMPLVERLERKTLLTTFNVMNAEVYRGARQARIAGLSEYIMQFCETLNMAVHFEYAAAILEDPEVNTSPKHLKGGLKAIEEACKTSPDYNKATIEALKVQYLEKSFPAFGSFRENIKAHKARIDTAIQEHSQKLTSMQSNGKWTQDALKHQSTQSYPDAAKCAELLEDLRSFKRELDLFL